MIAPFRDLFSRGAAAYARHRPTYPPALYAWLAGQAPATRRAWDCGTGNGQAALALAGHFDEVVATDASASQLACSRSHPRIKYRTAPAERSGLDRSSVDLVTVAQAMHWFDVSRFHEEVARVARPDAILAVWGYGRPSVAPDVDPVLDAFHDRDVAPYWPEERWHIDDRYASLPWPYASLDAPSFDMVADWTVEELLGYLGTWSAVQRYRDQRCVDPLSRLRDALVAAWGDPVQPRRVRWPLFLRVARLEPCAAGYTRTGP